MAELLPVNFLIPTEGAIASYNYTDIDEGVGYVSFDGFKSTNSAGTNTYQFTKLSPYTSGTTTNNLSLVFTVTTGTSECNIDTGAFSKPKILKGNTIVNFSAAVKRNGAGNSGLNLKLQLYHVDASSTETAIGSQWLAPQVLSSGGGDVGENWFCAVISCPETDFKIGEKLRLEVQAEITGSDADNVVVGIDPANRDIVGFLTPSSDARFFTTFTMLVPFKLVDL